MLEQREFFYLLLVVMDLPLEYALVVRTDRKEEQLVMREQALGHLVQMVAIALKVSIWAFIWVIEESDGANFVSNCYDGLVLELAYLQDLIVRTVLFTNIFKWWVWPKSLSKPLKLEIYRIISNEPSWFNFKKLYFP